MLDSLTALIAALNALSTGKFIALMIVALPVLLVAMVLGVVVLCLVGLAIAVIITVIYEWIRSIWFKIWLWTTQRTHKR